MPPKSAFCGTSLSLRATQSPTLSPTITASEHSISSSSHNNNNNIQHNNNNTSTATVSVQDSASPYFMATPPSRRSRESSPTTPTAVGSSIAPYAACWGGRTEGAPYSRVEESCPTSATVPGGTDAGDDSTALHTQWRWRSDSDLTKFSDTDAVREEHDRKQQQKHRNSAKLEQPSQHFMVTGEGDGTVSAFQRYAQTPPPIPFNAGNRPQLVLPSVKASPMMILEDREFTNVSLASGSSFNATCAPPQPQHPQQQQDGQTQARQMPLRTFSTLSISSGGDWSPPFTGANEGASIASLVNSNTRLSKCRRKLLSMTTPAFNMETIEAHQDHCDFLKDVCNAAECHPVSEITDLLWLGTWKDASDAELLRKNDITFVLNVAKELDPSQESAMIGTNANITSASIPMKDCHYQNVCEHLDRAFEFIEKARMQRARVLVHCRRGISRSAAIVIGYLMATRGMEYSDALHFVQERRPCVSLNLAFQEMLSEYKPSPKWRDTSASCTASSFVQSPTTMPKLQCQTTAAAGVPSAAFMTPSFGTNKREGGRNKCFGFASTAPAGITLPSLTDNRGVISAFGDAIDAFDASAEFRQDSGDSCSDPHVQPGHRDGDDDESSCVSSSEEEEDECIEPASPIGARLGCRVMRSAFAITEDDDGEKNQREADCVGTASKPAIRADGGGAHWDSRPSGGDPLGTALPSFQQHCRSASSYLEEEEGRIGENVNRVSSFSRRVGAALCREDSSIPLPSLDDSRCGGCVGTESPGSIGECESTGIASSGVGKGASFMHLGGESSSVFAGGPSMEVASSPETYAVATQDSTFVVTGASLSRHSSWTMTPSVPLQGQE